MAIAAILLLSPPVRLLIAALLVVVFFRLFRNGTLKLNPAWQRRPPGGVLAYRGRFPYPVIIVPSIILCFTQQVDRRVRLGDGLVLTLLCLIRLARKGRRRTRAANE